MSDYNLFMEKYKQKKIVEGVFVENEVNKLNVQQKNL